MTSLAGLSKIVVRFSPSSPLARPAREFLARVGCSKARATNPNCEVRAELVDSPSPSSPASPSTSSAGSVEVVSSDKKSSSVIDASGLSAEAIVQKVMTVGAAAAAAASGGPARGGGAGAGGAGAAAALASSSGPPPALTKQQLETAWGLAGAFHAGTASKVTP